MPAISLSKVSLSGLYIHIILQNQALRKHDNELSSNKDGEPWCKYSLAFSPACSLSLKLANLGEVSFLTVCFSVNVKGHLFLKPAFSSEFILRAGV